MSAPQAKPQGRSVGALAELVAARARGRNHICVSIGFGCMVVGLHGAVVARGCRPIASRLQRGCAGCAMMVANVVAEGVRNHGFGCGRNRATNPQPLRNRPLWLRSRS
jgi:hypothetical protein